MCFCRAVENCPPAKYFNPEPDERVWGPGKFLLEGPYDVIHDVIVCKSYVFGD